MKGRWLDLSRDIDPIDYSQECKGPLGSCCAKGPNRGDPRAVRGPWKRPCRRCGIRPSWEWRHWPIGTEIGNRWKRRVMGSLTYTPKPLPFSPSSPPRTLLTLSSQTVRLPVTGVKACGEIVAGRKQTEKKRACVCACECVCATLRIRGCVFRRTPRGWPVHRKGPWYNWRGWTFVRWS